MKHVVIVSPYFFPALTYGGPPRVLFTLAKALVQRGIKVSVITSDSLGLERSQKYKEQIEGIDIFRFQTISNSLAYYGKFFFIPNLLKQSIDILSQADVVLFSDTRSLLSWFVFPFLVTKGIPYGIFPYGQVEYDTSWKKIIKQVFDFIWVKIFFYRSNWVFVQTKHEASVVASYFELPKEKISLLPLPIESNQIRQKTQTGKAAQKKDLLFVGRFHKLKGVDLLIRSVIPLIEKDPEIRLFLVGRDDGYLSVLRSLIPKHLESNILIVGPTFGEELSKLYASSYCFVFTPTYHEETSTAALEALANGCPVVTTVQADIPYLEEYKAGYVVEAKESEIREAIKKVLLKRPKSSSTIALIKDHFVSSKVIACLLQYLQDPSL